MSVSRSDSQRLDSIDAKLSQIIELLTPKEHKVVISGALSTNGFSVDSDGTVEINDELAQLLPLESEKATPSRETTIQLAKLVPYQLKFGVVDGEYHYETPDNWVCRAKYIVNKEKRTIVCLLRGIATNTLYGRGIAKCDPNDTFNVDIGKAIALHRALKLDVPAEYFHIPKPTKLEVGQIIYWAEEFKFLVTQVNGDFGYFKRLSDGKEFNRCYVSKVEFGDATIIEDGVEV